MDELALEVLTGQESLDSEVGGGYSSDLLSDVMANAVQGDLWITLQLHQNIVAVATLNELAGIIVVNGRVPEDATLKKAAEEGVPILVTALPTFEIVGRLHGLGLRGRGKA